MEAGIADAFVSASNDAGKLEKLIVNDIEIGEGRTVKKNDKISVHYIGTFQDGRTFDNSYERGIPFVFTVGSGKVIKGWDDGVVGMKVGGKRILVIPGDLAYGNDGYGPIPPNTTLVFAIELLEIK